MHPLLMTLRGPVQACSFSGSFTFTSGSGTTVTSATRTATVPSGNSGQIQVVSQTPTGTVTFEYSKNGGAWTDCSTDPTNITLAHLDTLAFRIGNASSGEDMTWTVYDVTKAASIGTYVLTRT